MTQSIISLQCFVRFFHLVFSCVHEHLLLISWFLSIHDRNVNWILYMASRNSQIIVFQRHFGCWGIFQHSNFIQWWTGVSGFFVSHLQVTIRAKSLKVTASLSAMLGLCAFLPIPLHAYCFAIMNFSFSVYIGISFAFCIIKEISIFLWPSNQYY